MKNFSLTVYAFFIILFSGCDKEAPEAPDLTVCPPNSTCSYTFNDRASVVMRERDVTPGDSTVFVYEKKTTDYTASAYLVMRAGKNASSFDIGKNDIQHGHARFYFVCPVCDYIALQPVDGYAKGKRINSRKWLIEAQVILAAPNNIPLRDTIVLRQYFTPKKSS